MSLFSREEKHYERYAAALAATEPLRKQRDMRAKQTLRPFEYQVLKRRGKLSSARGICDLPKVDPNQRNGRLRVVCSGHVKTMSSVIRALGMTVPEFNGLSREVAANPDLRERVKLQAYYYRVAAELTRSAAAAEEIPPDVMQRPPEGGWGAAEQQQQQQQRQQQTPSKPPAKPKPEKPAPVPMVVFAKVSHRIEALRQRQENLLKQELKMEASELPPGICGAAYGPLLNPKVRGLCQTFPAEVRVLPFHSLFWCILCLNYIFSAIVPPF